MATKTQQPAAADNKDAENNKMLSDLFDAIGDGNAEYVSVILQIVKDPIALLRRKDLQGLTPLRKAVSLNKADIARRLVLAGADAGQKGALDKTALHEASLMGQRMLLAPLLASSGISVNVKDKFGMTPLHNAVRGKHIKFVEWLLFAGADVQACNNNEETPLHFCNANSEDEDEAQIYKLLTSSQPLTDCVGTTIRCGYVGQKGISRLGSDGQLTVVTSDLWPVDPQFIFCVTFSPDSANPRIPCQHDELFYCDVFKYRLMYKLPDDKRRVKLFFTVLEEFLYSELNLKVTSKSKYLGEVPMKITTYPFHKYMNFLASCELDLQNEGQFVLTKRPHHNLLSPDIDGILSNHLLPDFQLVTTKDTFPSAAGNWNDTRKARAEEDFETLLNSLPPILIPEPEPEKTADEDANENKSTVRFDINTNAAESQREDSNQNKAPAASIMKVPEEEEAEDGEEDDTQVLLDWSEPDTCEDFYYSSAGWACYLQYRRVCTLQTVMKKFATVEEIEEPIVSAFTNFFKIDHSSKTMKGECLCQIPKSPEFVKVGTVIILQRQDLAPDEKEDPIPDETIQEFEMSEDGRHTHGQLWLEKEMKRWSFVSSGFANKPTRLIFKVKELSTYVAVQLNIGEEQWESESESEEESDEEVPEGEGEEGAPAEDQEPKKKKKKKKKKNDTEENEEGNTEQEGDENASNIVSAKDTKGNRNNNENMDYIDAEDTIFVGILPLEEEFASNMDDQQDLDPLEEQSSEKLGGFSMKMSAKLSAASEGEKEELTFGQSKTEEDYEEEQQNTLMAQVALMWRCRNHRLAKILLFTRHRTGYFFDMILELIQESDISVRAECRWSEGFKMVASSQAFLSLPQHLFTFNFEGLTIESPENGGSRPLFYYSIRTNELVYIVKRALHDDPVASKKMKKKEDPAAESHEIDGTLRVITYPKGNHSDENGYEVLTLPVPLTGPNLWKEKHLQLREPDRVLLDSLVEQMKEEPLFTENWWKMWILLKFDEKQIDAEKTKQDWPGISEMLLNKWFEKNFDARDRGLTALIYALDSIGLDLPVAKILLELKSYKVQLRSEIKQPRVLDLLFHWVIGTKMTLSSFRRKNSEPKVLWPLSDQFLLYLSAYLNYDLFMDIGHLMDVEDNILNSINGEEFIADPTYKVFKVLIRAKQKKDEIVGFSVLLTDMMRSLHQNEASEYLIRECRKWMASVIEDSPDTCNKLERVLNSASK